MNAKKINRDFDEDKEYTLKQEKSAKYRSKNRSHWNAQENVKYCQFLCQNKAIFESENPREKSGIFSGLARHILTRNKYCVKSHHHKMIKRHKNVDEIIHNVQKKYKIRIMHEKEVNIILTEPLGQANQGSIYQKLPDKQDSQQKENQYYFNPNNDELEQIDFDGFDVSSWQL